jgi:hypothetical protein
MKKLIIFLLFVIVTIALILFVTTKISTAHIAARRAIAQSRYVGAAVGVPQYIILLGFSQKTGPIGKGCTSLMYWVIGAKDNKLMYVHLTSESYQSGWTVIEILKGDDRSQQLSCHYG